jgi:hypothetical protein
VLANVFPNASRLGFGCASLGSRIGRREGLRALAKAHDLGINWFDLAPPYGDGEAEPIFAEFVKGRRGRIHICTKCGLAPSNLGRLQRLAKPMVQSVVRAVPQLRQVVSRGRRGASAMAISSALFRESLDLSLRRLGTDHIEIYALHDPAPKDLEREDVQRAMQDVLASGKARVVGVAGDFEAAVAIMRAELPVSFVQLADPPFEGILECLRATLGADWPSVLSTHSIFGRSNPLAMLSARAGSQVRLLELLRAQGYVTPLEDAARSALLDYALMRNPKGIVLVSMFSAGHLERNAASLERTPSRGVQDLFAVLSGGLTAVGHVV